MKKLLILGLALVMLLSLCACTPKSEGQDADTSVETTQSKQAKDLNMQSLYDAFGKAADLSEMEVWDDLEFFGIEPGDVKQAVLAVHGPGTQADEIWLIEAVDADAAKAIAELAESHRKYQSDMYSKYAPEQHKVLEKAEILQSGNYVVMIVSPEVEKLVKVFHQETGL